MDTVLSVSNLFFSFNSLKLDLLFLDVLRDFPLRDGDLGLVYLGLLLFSLTL